MLAVRSLRFLQLIHIRPLSTSRVLSSGHNKWSKIKGQKAITDRQRGILCGNTYNSILLAARLGGSPDPELNAGLAAILKRAKTNGVPKENIDRALKKAAGTDEKAGQLVTYEAMAFGSVALIIECLTENPSRTAKFTRNILAKNQAHVTPVAFLFQRKGAVRVAIQEGDDFDARLERLVDTALTAEAEDFEQDEPDEGSMEVEFICQPNALAKLTSAVTAPGVCEELVSSEYIYSPTDKVEPPSDEEAKETLARLLDELEEQTDTLRVWTNLDS